MVGMGTMIGAGIFVLTGLDALVHLHGCRCALRPGLRPQFIEFAHLYWEGLPDWPVVYTLLAVAGFVRLNDRIHPLSRIYPLSLPGEDAWERARPSC